VRCHQRRQGFSLVRRRSEHGDGAALPKLLEKQLQLFWQRLPGQNLFDGVIIDVDALSLKKLVKHLILSTSQSADCFFVCLVIPSSTGW
jgi:hypothetical protein